MRPLPTIIDSSFEVADRVAVLTMDREDLRNALTGTALVNDIVNAVEWVNSCDDVSVLILTGAGSVFSAGGNIREMHSSDQAAVAACPES